MHNLRDIKVNSTTQLTLVRFFFGISAAFLDTIWSIYMKSLGLDDSLIGYLNALFLIISIIFLFNCVNILEKFSERKAFIVSSIITIITLILFGLINSIFLFIILGIFFTLSNILRRNSFEILFKDNSPKKKLILNESILSVIINIGWFLGPITAGFIFAKYGFSIVFYIASFFSLISLILFFKINFLVKKEIIYTKKSFKFLLNNFLKAKELRLPYLMSMGVAMWWSFIFIYVPLFIYDSGIGNEYIGIFIGLSQMPLIIFEYFAGKNSQKNGFKGSFSKGYFCIAIFALLAFIFSDNIYAVISILILASIPMAFIEPLRFPFLFSKIPSKLNEDEVIPLFTSSMAFGSLISKVVIATLLLFVVETGYTYLLMGFLMLVFSIIALKIK